MKNFKKIAFGLLVGALALGFSAFTSAKPKTTTFYYGLNQAANQYISAGITDPSAGCNSVSTDPSCVISYPTSQGSGFAVGSVPSGGTPSSTKGWVSL